MSKDELVMMFNCVFAAFDAKFPGIVQRIEKGDTVDDIVRKNEISKAIMENSGVTQ